LAIKQAIAQKNPDAVVIFVGTRHGSKRQSCHENTRLSKRLDFGFSRSHALQNILLPLKLAASLAQSVTLLKSFRPRVVIGTGGYVMGPILWTAQRLGIPTLIQEQNSHPGWTTRKLAPKASIVCVGI